MMGNGNLDVLYRIPSDTVPFEGRVSRVEPGSYNVSFNLGEREQGHSLNHPSWESAQSFLEGVAIVYADSSMINICRDESGSFSINSGWLERNFRVTKNTEEGKTLEEKE